jgi:pyridoxamine 5'-phosphate oxidase-like protein
MTPDDRRRLTAAEQEHLLALPVPGVLSTIADEGWIHSVPVHFHVHDQEIRIIAERDAVKTRNVGRTGRATMCVVTTGEDERRYVMLEGPVAIEERVSDEDLELLDTKYGFERDGDDAVSFQGSITLVMRPERRIAWADFDE